MLTSFPILIKSKEILFS